MGWKKKRKEYRRAWRIIGTSSWSSEHRPCSATHNRHTDGERGQLIYDQQSHVMRMSARITTVDRYHRWSRRTGHPRRPELELTVCVFRYFRRGRSEIVRDNLRGDMCRFGASVIQHTRKHNHRNFLHLIKLYVNEYNTFHATMPIKC